MAKRIHAPQYEQDYCTVPDNPVGGDPLCNVNADKPPIAKPGDMVTCAACLSKLWDHPQWLHRLMADGYLFPAGRKPPKASRRKVDPRQMDLADMLGKE